MNQIPSMHLVPPPPGASSAPDDPPATATCQKCEGVEWITVGLTSAPCECRVARVARERVAGAIEALPARVRGYTREAWIGEWPEKAARLAQWPTVTAGQIVRPWAIVITGDQPGTGKTHLGTALYLAALPRLANPAAALWVTAADAHRLNGGEIRGRIAAEKADRAYTGRDTRRALHDAPLLLWDDLGREGKPTDASVALILSVLMHRHAWALPTILPTNFRDRLGFHAYDPALTSRLSEDTIVISRANLPDQRTRRTA